MPSQEHPIFIQFVNILLHASGISRNLVPFFWESNINPFDNPVVEVINKQ
jgi:hypothetical protein